MTNKGKYKQAFSKIHVSDEFFMEVEKMKKVSKKQKFNTMVASIATCMIIVGSSTAAYAADLGGIQRTAQLWIYGDQTQATIDFNSDGSYDIEYLDSEGNIVNVGGGGLAFNPDGSERPLSEKEIMEQIESPVVKYEDDGSVWVYYFNQKIDITDKFDDNVCYVQVSNGEKLLYMTIEYQKGYSTSPRKYPRPSSFN